MKVLFLTPEYPPQPSGGIGTGIQQLARGLAANGHEAWVVTLGPDRRLEDRGVQVAFHQIDHPRGLGWLVVRRALGRAVRRVVQAEGIDIVVAPDWLGLSAGLDAGCPVLVSCNGSATYFGDLLDEPVHPRDRMAERLALRGADAVGAVSRFTAERSQALFSLGRCPTVIPNGVDLDRFPLEPVDVDTDLVAHVGTIVRKKGVIDLGRGFSRVVDAHPATRLVIAGADRPDRRTGHGSTRSLVEEHLSPAAREATTWVGAIGQDEVAELVSRAALCVFPSYAEANPVAWLEAMAGRTPILGYDHPWAAEVVDHGVTGWLVAPRDTDALASAWITALDDAGRLRAMGDRARAVVAHRFSVDVVVAQSVRWYGEVARGSLRPVPR